ncbi:proline-rich protein HaeIII subfamily 1-like [Scylla paramamosain]|uniref:proline-rich protein HaeIII subfamily 1-like n=1 Tax=Scylla paramamosain TaxID=85552 RepID=UPI0030829FAB
MGIGFMLEITVDVGVVIPAAGVSFLNTSTHHSFTSHQVFQSQPARPPKQQVFQPPPSPQPRPPQTQRPFVPSPPDLANFGAPRPDTILNAPSPQQPPQGPPRPSPQQSFPSQGFPAPLPDLSDNNIIGMTPPPPPPPRARPQLTTTRPRPPQPPPQLQPQPQAPRAPPPRPLTTGLPQRPFTSPQSNSVDELLVNPVPAVNAGVLPLANEKPQQPQLFPPLISIR